MRSLTLFPQLDHSFLSLKVAFGPELDMNVVRCAKPERGTLAKPIRIAPSMRYKKRVSIAKLTLWYPPAGKPNAIIHLCEVFFAWEV